MGQSGGRAYRAIPGPSVVPDEVLRAMHRASPNIYGGALEELTEGLIDDLKRVARTKHHAAIYMCNGHGAWEAAFANIMAPGDELLALKTGLFGESWSMMAKRLGGRVQSIEFDRNSPVDPNRVEDALAVDKNKKVQAVLLSHVDTSTSIRNHVKEVRAAIDAARHPALLVVDCIASLGCDQYEMDEWGADITIAASQKGLMVPPGLGLVFFNDRAAARRRELDLVSPYWDWEPRVSPDLFYQYFCGTAPTHHLFGLRTALDLIHEEGVEAVWARHRRLARAIWAACDAWSQEGPLRLNVREEAHRSCAVTSLGVGAPFGTELRRWLEVEAGVTLGIGLGMETTDDPHSDGFFRIGHMGHVNAHMVLGVLASIEAGMSALKIPHGADGVGAAARALNDQRV